MTKAQAAKLKAELTKAFDATKVEVEQVDAKQGRYRFAIISPEFNKIPHLTRQDQIWEVVDQVLSRESADDITLILAYAPDELEQPV